MLVMLSFELTVWEPSTAFVLLTSCFHPPHKFLGVLGCACHTCIVDELQVRRDKPIYLCRVPRGREPPEMLESVQAKQCYTVTTGLDVWAFGQLLLTLLNLQSLTPWPRL